MAVLVVFAQDYVLKSVYNMRYMDKKEIIKQITEKEIENEVAIIQGDIVLEAIKQYKQEKHACSKKTGLENADLEAGTSAGLDYEIVGLFDYRDSEYYAVLLPKKTKISPSTFLFTSDFIPFLAEEWEDNGEPAIGKMFQEEIKKASSDAYEAKKSPLFVTGSYESGTMPAWDIQNKTSVTIEGYRTCKSSFTLIYENGKKEVNSKKYYVHMPSKAFRILTGINCSPKQISEKSTQERWEKRPFYIPEDNILKLINEQELDPEVYKKAISLLTDSYIYDNESQRAYSMLENRLRHYERLLSYGAPRSILEKEQDSLIDLINESK